MNVSRVCFGTARLHHLLWSVDRQRILAAARDGGVTHFDTAPYYGFGIAEHELGRFLGGRKSGLTISTKIGLYPPAGGTTINSAVWLRKIAGRLIPSASAPAVNWSVRVAKESVDASLRALGVDEIDLLLLHEPSGCLRAADALFEWIETECRRGRVREWGLAGEAAGMRPLLDCNHPIGRVLQVRDSVDLKEADILDESGRAAQFRFGYLAAMRRLPIGTRLRDLLSAVRDRNQCGSVIVSSTSVARLGEVLMLFEEAGVSNH